MNTTYPDLNYKLTTIEGTEADNEVRCVMCGTLLGRNLQGTIEIKCYKSDCKAINEFEYK